MNFLRRIFGASSTFDESQAPVFTEQGLTAYFKQPDGTSCPGIDWCVRIRESGKTVLVRTYFSTDPPRESERQTLAEQAVAVVEERMKSGWVPKAGDFVEAEKK